MVLIRTMSMDQAYRAIDWRSLFLVAGMLPLGVALNKTGASILFANVIRSTLGSRGHFILLIGFVFLTVALTQVINGAAAVTVIAPIAIATAQKVGMEPRSVAMAMALASSMAFMSPLGHSVNVMVMGAGGYSFRDYLRVGIPLTIVLVIILMIDPAHDHADRIISMPTKTAPPPQTPLEEEPVWTYRGYRLKTSEFVTAMVHLFRAEIQRANVWRHASIPPRTGRS